MSKILFVDFDETLFYHYIYLQWVDAFLAKRNIILQPGIYEARVEDFHEVKGENLRIYDHEGHLKSVSKRSWSYVSGEIEKEIHRASHDFCYDDAHDFLERAVQSQWDVRILTYGNGEYQRYKIKTCRILSDFHIPVHVVTEPKKDFLTREFADTEGVLVDDKQPLHLPKNWKHVWIDRTGTRRKLKEEERVESVKSLDEIEL